MAKQALMVRDNEVSLEEGTTPFTIEGTVVITIGTEEFVLEGLVGSFIDVQYHTTIEKGLIIGTIPQMLGDVAKALGLSTGATGFEGTVNGALDSLANVPLVSTIATALKTWEIRVTDLGINTKTKVYQFGFGVQLPPGTKVGPIAVQAFTVKITYTGT